MVDHRAGAANDDITIDATGASRIRIAGKGVPGACRRRYGLAPSVSEMGLQPSMANIRTRKSTAKLLDEAAQGEESDDGVRALKRTLFALDLVASASAASLVLEFSC
jgi:hypothetical protein